MKERERERERLKELIYVLSWLQVYSRLFVLFDWTNKRVKRQKEREMTIFSKKNDTNDWDYV